MKDFYDLLLRETWKVEGKVLDFLGDFTYDIVFLS